MSSVFDVYQHDERGQFGVSVQTDAVQLATISKDGTLKLQMISPLKMGGEVIKRVKQGYTRVQKAKYLRVTKGELGELKGEFTEGHPDLGDRDLELVLFVGMPNGLDRDGLAAMWQERFDRVSGTLAFSDKWIFRLLNAGQYIASFNDHPAMSLVIADWAISTRQVLLCRSGESPRKPPSADPLAWKEFLAQWFKQEAIQKSLEALGWSLKDLYLAPQAQVMKPQPDVDGEDIFFAAQQASF